MGKNSKANRKKDEQKQEAPWEEQQPLNEFFRYKGEKTGSRFFGGRPPVHKADEVQKGDAGIVQMNYKSFEHRHLNMAKEQQEEPLAYLIHGTAAQFHAKFPQIPKGRFWDREWPTLDPKTMAEPLKSGIILQMGKGSDRPCNGKSRLLPRQRGDCGVCS